MRSILPYQQMRRAILAWHDRSARDLPWRGQRDPYRIWVSEIMLQQTRAETVIPYYLRFLEHYPTVEALAAAPEEALLKDWEGLGYYSRARNLHRAAQVVAGELGGRFPQTVQGLCALPGVGAYTAGAVASMAFGLPEPAIDGNQVRVLSRLFAVQGEVQSPPVKKRLREQALLLLDRERPGDFNQALMGLGALICLPRNPKCSGCPAAHLCLAKAQELQGQLPQTAPKAGQRVERRAVALVFWEDKVLVRQRPDKGLLARMWEFPHFLQAESGAALEEALAEMGVALRGRRTGPQARHVFTHLIWEMTGYICRAASGQVQGGRYVDREQLAALPMASAHRVYREEAMSRL